jgi:hypothetical protein
MLSITAMNSTSKREKLITIYKKLIQIAKLTHKAQQVADYEKKLSLMRSHKRRLAVGTVSSNKKTMELATVYQKLIKIAELLGHPHRARRQQAALNKVVLSLRFDVNIVGAKGKFMRDAPMFVAHELPAFATLVDGDGKQIALPNTQKQKTEKRTSMCNTRAVSDDERPVVAFKAPLTLTVPLKDLNFRLSLTTDSPNAVGDSFTPNILLYLRKTRLCRV